MPRVVTAQVTRLGGRTFQADVANLTLGSVFLMTREQLEFRDRVNISMLGVAIHGEVALVTNDPCPGAIVAFTVARNVSDVLAEHLEEIEVIGPGSERPRIHVARLEHTTDPMPALLAKSLLRRTHPETRDSDVSDSLENETLDDLQLEGDTIHEDPSVEALVQGVRSPSQIPRQSDEDSMDRTPANMPVQSGPIAAPDLFGRPPLVKKPAKKSSSSPSVVPSDREPRISPLPRTHSSPTRASAPAPHPTIDLASVPLTDDLQPKMSPPPPLPTGVGSAQGVRSGRDRIPAMTEKRDLSADYPPIASDGTTVDFSSLAHFRAHYDATIINGGLIVRSQPLPHSTHRVLRFRIPGVDQMPEVTARVAFVGKDGTVGFMIEPFTQTTIDLQAIANQTEIAPKIF